MKNEIQKHQAGQIATRDSFTNLNGELVIFKSGVPRWSQICEHVTNEKELVLLKERGELELPGFRKIAKESAPNVKLELLKMLRKVGITLNAPNLYEPDFVDFFFEALRDSDEFYYYSLPDVWLALKRGALGIYGKLYGVPNLNTLFEWLREYENRRLGQVETVRDRQKDEHEIDAPRGDNSIKTILKNFKP